MSDSKSREFDGIRPTIPVKGPPPPKPVSARPAGEGRGGVRSQEEIEAGARKLYAALSNSLVRWDGADPRITDEYRSAFAEALDAADAVAAPAVGVGERSAQKLISDLVSAWDRIPKRVLDSDYEEKWTAYLEARDCMMDALTASSEGGGEAGENA